KAIENIPNEYTRVCNGDTFFTSILGHYGKSKYHTDIKPAAYRVHSGGIWSSQSKKKKRDMIINTFYWLYRYYDRIGENEYANHFLLKYQKLVLTNTSNKLMIKEMRKRPYIYTKRFIKKSLSRFYSFKHTI
ncbi:MAG: hypothetical protein KAI79_10765, partial [Bacteroidales bacterium]|nr:hypothetical protein [Bacteroidales bacterium]